MTSILQVFAAIVIVGFLLLFLLTPRISHHRASAERMQSSTQLRGIHTSLVLYAQDNDKWFPGFGPGGTRDADFTVSRRYRTLLEATYFTGEYAISPFETMDAWSTGPVTTANFSYAMLSLDNTEGTRAHEWRDTLNAEAAAVSDRLTRGVPGDPATYRGLQTPARDTGWRGAVGWNDNHVSFETDAMIHTKYGDAPAITDDDLFIEAKTGSDALMVYN